MNEKEIKDLLNTIEDQIPDDYCRSYDSADGLCHTWPDEDSWQYKTLKYIKQLQQENQQLKEQLQQRDEVIEECIESIQNFMTHIDDGFCADMMTFIDILNKYKGDKNGN